MLSGRVVDFNDVFRAEIAVINERRARQEPPRVAVVLEPEADDHVGEPVLGPDEEAKLVGLALSGGGVRSSAFCLGALQALHEAGVLAQVDYLSTVSGGGYIGCSLSAGLESTRGKFPFESRVIEEETPSLQHLRDHSNYLFPRGAVDFLRNASIYARGLVANFVLIMPFLLAAAALTIFWHPIPDALHRPAFLNRPELNIFGFQYFVVTAYLSIALVVGIVGWSLLRSLPGLQSRPEVPSGPTTFIGWVVLLLLLCAFCELQPFVLAGMFDEHPGFFAVLSKSVNTVSAALAPVAAVLGFLATKLGEFVKSATESTRTRAKIAGYAAKAAIYLAAFAVPLVLWAIYLNITYWGLCMNAAPVGCAPPWLAAPAHHWFGAQPAVAFYLAIAAIFFVLSLLLQPNANSLHPLYRDRLGKAFLFAPQAGLPKNEELKPLSMRLSLLSGQYGPYHLINAALNVQNSKTANKRGRNADFFLFSQSFVGSETTGYVATKDIETIATGLDLATAMAVSGAAASSSMGAQSIKPLTPTLAMLNIRLGYWLRNPRRVANPGFLKFRNIWANFYFLLELFGRLHERLKSVYLTDGGHIENLGLYELLKRRCRVIIAVDAEADWEMAFGSFNTLVRYARIDLGLEIDLPWQQITDKSLATSKAIDEKGDTKKSKGPHCAIGQITYPNGRKGILVYIKSSLTGDENDYVFHYKKRYSDFPHETTLDQMFSEEQFEAYRALGYHAAYGLFDRRDDFAKLDPKEFPKAREQVALLDELFPRATNGGAPVQFRSFSERFSEGRSPPVC
jgi:predicted acylesterase/phospholipase RssA